MKEAIAVVGEQVISAALQRKGLACIPIGSEEARDVIKNPAKEAGAPAVLGSG